MEWVAAAAMDLVGCGPLHIFDDERGSGHSTRTKCRVEFIESG